MKMLRLRRGFGGQVVAIVCGLGLAALLAACAGMPAPETPAQRLVAAEASFTAVVEALVSSRDAGLIEPGSPAAQAIGNGIMTAQAALNATHAAVVAGNADSATTWLQVALSAIGELQRALEAARAATQADGLSLGPPASLAPAYSTLAFAGG